MIQETRRCHYDAHDAVCGQPGASTDPTLCLTPAEAAVVNEIWDGPRNPDGTKQGAGPLKGNHDIGNLPDLP